jgi:hypothetical protein
MEPNICQMLRKVPINKVTRTCDLETQEWENGSRKIKPYQKTHLVF